MKTLALVVGAALMAGAMLAAEPPLINTARPAASAAPPAAAPYLAAVRQFADQVLAHGRDVYGKPTPLFVDGLNVDTLEPVKWKWADGKEWVLCNLANQQGLFRALDGLSRLTGDAALQGLRRSRPCGMRSIICATALRTTVACSAGAGTWPTTPRTTCWLATRAARAAFTS